MASEAIAFSPTAGTALEVDENGKEVWRYQVPKSGKGRYPEGTVQDLLRLDNGNTVIGCTVGNVVVEVDPKGKIVWQVDNKDLGKELIPKIFGVWRNQQSTLCSST